MRTQDRNGPTCLAKPDRLLTVQEAAARVAVSTDALYELVRSGRIPAVHLGRRVRLDPAQLESWIAQGGRKCGPRKAQRD